MDSSHTHNVWRSLVERRYVTGQIYGASGGPDPRTA
jgi:hypothetical protein